MQSPSRDPVHDVHESLAAVERFLASCRRPVLLEPGEPLIALLGGNHVLETRGGRLLFQAWDDRRNVVRRVTGVRDEKPGKMELMVERFGQKPGLLLLIDMERPSWREWERRSARLIFRETLREFLQRQFPGWRIAELSSEADLAHSLSPAYPRGWIVEGRNAWAVIGADRNTDTPAALTFGLIWLDYLRKREPRTLTRGLILFLPAGRENPVVLRLKHLSPEVGRFEVFSYSEDGLCAHLDPADSGNLDSRLETACGPNPAAVEWMERLGGAAPVGTVLLRDGSASFRVRGLEFARTRGGQMLFGLDQPVVAGAHHAGEIKVLAETLARFRHPSGADRRHPLYGRDPEAWLESQVRAALETLDASLLPAPVYGQVPALAGGDRGVIDLLACERSGRLVVIELKATADPQLPLQALDYWMRVAWHAGRGEFSPLGYFPGIRLRPDPPRLLLVAPALEFHPTTETILRCFAPAVPVERLGVGVEWRSRLEVLFRLEGAEAPG